ncbi:MAG: hypothetical protein SFX74_10345 [Fimbriimonadaceae bacterium]|nr:hypothetical protein [Fimbriimonadaceae bacterium]
MFTAALTDFFRLRLQDAIVHEVGLPLRPSVDRYLAELLVRFTRTTETFSLQDEHGRPITRLSEMLEHGDVRARAWSFRRERDVHKHIGDVLLFWSGVFPEFLRTRDAEDQWIEPHRQGPASYLIAASYRVPPCDSEAETLHWLSRDFEGYAYALKSVRKAFGA